MAEGSAKLSTSISQKTTVAPPSTESEPPYPPARRKASGGGWDGGRRRRYAEDGDKDAAYKDEDARDGDGDVDAVRRRGCVVGMGMDFVVVIGDRMAFYGFQNQFQKYSWVPFKMDMSININNENLRMSNRKFCRSGSRRKRDSREDEMDYDDLRHPPTVALIHYNCPSRRCSSSFRPDAVVLVAVV
ncbi:hypothetical protein RHMOL_Rhmol09G0124300 [Rhododendron molle]|uniref:Uncharacterized protein n=1 Tax=Rhododendron molle TaxID=49168 RepID=A0ACC0ME98_RHOML|nr:hypothetical protein RHMOL_Rhmol09G0124300 [Rhododendron molle]